jgi:hypothetical protein
MPALDDALCRAGFAYPIAVDLAGLINSAVGSDTASVAVDTFKQVIDIDDTQSFLRAVAAGSPINLGPRTYSISNLTWASGTPGVTIVGIEGKSVVQRNTNSITTQPFISISSAYVLIDGVTFDYNSTHVSSNQWGFLCSGQPRGMLTIRLYRLHMLSRWEEYRECLL